MWGIGAGNRYVGRSWLSGARCCYFLRARFPAFNRIGIVVLEIAASVTAVFVTLILWCSELSSLVLLGTTRWGIDRLGGYWSSCWLRSRWSRCITSANACYPVSTYLSDSTDRLTCSRGHRLAGRRRGRVSGRRLRGYRDGGSGGLLAFLGLLAPKPLTQAGEFRRQRNPELH